MMTTIPTFLLVLVGAILLVYFILLIKFSSTIRNSILLEKLIIFLFILLISGSYHRIGFLTKFNPNNLLVQGDPPGVAFIVASIIFSAALICLNVKLRITSKAFLTGLTYFITYNPFLFALILLTPLSAFWSITPLFTLARGVIFAGVITAAIYVGTCYQWNDIFNLLKWGFASAMLQSAFLAIALPSIGLHPKGWQGSYGHAGTLGLYAALTSLLWLIQFTSQRKNRLLSGCILGLSIFVMQQTNSATGLILFIQGVGLVLVMSLMKKLKPRVGFLVMVTSLPAVVLIAQGLLYYFNNILTLLGKDSDLTGRGEFWPQIIEKISERPILGYGFEGFWLSWKGELNPASSIINSNLYVPPHSHNGFLDLALSLGIIGLMLYIFTFFSCIFYICKSLYANQSSVIIPLILLLFIVVSNTSGNGLWEVGFHSFLFALISTRLTLDAVGFQYTYDRLNFNG